jgi:hypothetical protein
MQCNYYFPTYTLAMQNMVSAHPSSIQILFKIHYIPSIGSRMLCNKLLIDILIWNLKFSVFLGLELKRKDCTSIYFDCNMVISFTLCKFLSVASSYNILSINIFIVWWSTWDNQELISKRPKFLWGLCQSSL